MLYEHFQIEGVNLLRDLVTDRDWLVKLDLNDAYSRINVAEKFQNVPNFFMKKKFKESTSISFGIATVPREASNCNITSYVYTAEDLTKRQFDIEPISHRYSI